MGLNASICTHHKNEFFINGYKKEKKKEIELGRNLEIPSSTTCSSGALAGDEAAEGWKQLKKLAANFMSGERINVVVFSANIVSSCANLAGIA